MPAPKSRHGTATQTLSASVRLECEVHRLAFARSDGNLLRHRSQFFMPGLNRVLTRRKIRQLEAAVFASHGKVRMLEDCDVALHPGMYVALHRNSNFFAWKAFFHAGPRWLRFVPF